MEMPDEATQAPDETQDKPEPDQGPEATQEAPESADKPEAGQEEESFYDLSPNELPEELQPTYKSMQAAFTRKNQELARMRKEAEQAMAFYDAALDPEREAEVLAALGYELTDDEADDPEGLEGYADGYADYVDPELQDVRAELDDLRNQWATQSENDYLVHEIAGIENRINRQLEADEMNLVAQLALANRMPDGLPDVQTAWATLQDLYAREQKRWMAGKKGTPRPPGQGVAEPDERVDLSDPEVRRQRMEQVIARELESAS